MDLFEKTIDSKEIFKGRIIDVKLDNIELPNGSKSTREVVIHNGGVCVAALSENNTLKFVRQFRYPYGKVLLELPAGKLEKGEDPMKAGLRELEEECGIKAEKAISMGRIYPTVAYCNEIIHLFLVTDYTASKQHLDEGEYLTVEDIALDRAVELVMSGEISDSKTVALVLKTARFLEERKNERRFVLASGSPRRSELLKNAGYEFEVLPSNADEALEDGIDPKSAVEALCQRKAQDVLEKRVNCVVLGCDTVVSLDGKILGKPKNKDDERQMLRLLSGKKHCVYTGVCVADKDKSRTFCKMTEVEFYPLSDETIESYIETEEPNDKAGSYGIQGYGSALVKGISGDYFSVVGLPIAETVRVLSEFGINGKIKV